MNLIIIEYKTEPTIIYVNNLMRGKKEALKAWFDRDAKETIVIGIKDDNGRAMFRLYTTKT